MIVWLASYPRSGNHLLRTILSRSFGLGSYSVYQLGVTRAGPALDAAIGTLTFDDGTTEAFVARARASANLFLIKTHDLVPDADRCIYVVRDGRPALASYRRFVADVEGIPCSVSDLIQGRRWPGRWHAHVERFLARDPARTLILAYEDLASPVPPLDRLAAFLGIAVQRSFDVRFSDLQSIDPKMFPAGGNAAGIDAVERENGAEFWASCGPTMHKLGYGTPAAAAPVAQANDGDRPYSRPLLPIDGERVALAGFDDMEGPFPEKRVKTAFQWAVGRTAAFRVFSARVGTRTLSLKVSAVRLGQTISVRIDGGPAATRWVRRRFPQFQSCAFTQHFPAGATTVEITIHRRPVLRNTRRVALALGEIRFADDEAS